MRLTANSITLCLVLAFIVGPAGALAQAPEVLSTQPVQSAISAPTSASISVTFDSDMDAATIDAASFVVNASSTGLHLGTITYDNPTRSATLIPLEPFFAGEAITVTLTTDIKSSLGTPLADSYVWAFTIAVSDGSGTFYYTNDYHMGNTAGCVYPADLDGDGDLDIPTIDQGGSGYLSVMLNNGNGIFTWDAHYDLAYDPQTIVATDLDKDGDMDIAAAHHGQTYISVQLNNGNATFAAKVGYTGGDDIRSVCAADLDGDGDIDLASANTGSDDISVFFNNGSAVFSAGVPYGVGGGPVSVCAADFDGDGDFDLATSNGSSDSVSVIFNHGDGSFGPDSLYSDIGTPIRIIAADLNGDGAPDLATANWDSDETGVLINNGTGGFAHAVLYPAGDYATGISCGDVDNDCDIDLLTVNRHSDNVSLLINNGNGTFAPQVTFPVGRQPSSVLCADLDGDGDLDFATGGITSAAISVWLNIDALSVFSTLPVQNELDVAANTDISVTFNTDMQAGTINGNTFVVHTSTTGQHNGIISYDPGTRTATFDPDVDFAEGEMVTVVLTENITSSQGAPLTDGYCWSFTIEANQCTGMFTDGLDYAVGGDIPLTLCPADLDDDGDIDLVVPNSGTWSDPGSTISVLLNNGDRTFAAPVAHDVGSYPVGAVSADFNGDGYPDVASANWFHSNASILLSDGAGGFVSRAEYPVGHTPNSLNIADLNGDGHIDVITASRLGGNVSVLLNNNDGTFLGYTHYTVGDMPKDVITGDFDGDGDIDLATGNVGASVPDSTISILMNDGDGAFGSPVLHSTKGRRPGSLCAADLDEDGDLDIVAGNYESDNICVFLNNGDGEYSLDAIYPAGDLNWSVVPADTDGDGDQDLIVANRGANSVSVFTNNGNGTFQAAVDYPVGVAPRGAVAADFSGNGSLDLAAVNTESVSVSVLWNFCGPGYTPSGSDITVDLGDSLSITFDEVVSPGTTEVVTSTQGPPPPTGFKLVPSAPPVYYEITTTAVYYGNITVCFTYDEADLKGPEKNLRIFHRTGDPAVWENATFSVDEVNNRICGVVASLSPFVLAEVVVPVTLDIKPGSCPNPLNVKTFYKNDPESGGGDKGSSGRRGTTRSRAVLPVAILGAEDFEITDIDASTVRLEGVSPLRWSNEDVSTPVDGSAEECECISLRADGYMDLSLKFDKKTIVDSLGEVYDGEDVTLTLTGELYDGTLIEGTDCVVIRGGTPRPDGEPLEIQPAMPATVRLEGNYPNPFNPCTSIEFALPEAVKVRLEVFNIRGQKVATLVDGHLNAGEHSVLWDASDAASGVYLYRLTAGDFVEARKMMLLK